MSCTLKIIFVAAIFNFTSSGPTFGFDDHDALEAQAKSLTPQQVEELRERVNAHMLALYGNPTESVRNVPTRRQRPVKPPGPTRQINQHEQPGHRSSIMAPYSWTQIPQKVTLPPAWYVRVEEEIEREREGYALAVDAVGCEAAEGLEVAIEEEPEAEGIADEPLPQDAENALKLMGLDFLCS
jgi:hypothetical protein